MSQGPGMTATTEEGDGKDKVQKFHRWLDFWPESNPKDKWRSWHIREGNRVEVYNVNTDEVFGGLKVVAANPRFLKLEDGLLFEQYEGVPVWSGRQARVRVRKVKR
jgi:hypothetical protein